MSNGNRRKTSDEELPEEAARLIEARVRRGFDGAKAAAQHFGWNYDTYIQHERGVNGLRKAVAEKYAKAFRVSVGWLLTGEGDENMQGISLVGLVGADARPDAVIFMEGQGNFAHDLPVPPNARPGTVAVEVRGDSMRGTAKDGWLVYYDTDDVHGVPFDGLIGELCVCWLLDGRVLLKEIQAGREPGRFDLESMNAPTLRDQAVERATRVTAIVPRGRNPKSDALGSSVEAVEIR